MNHNVKISVTKEATSNPILACRTRKVNARLWSWLFGKHRVVILVPGHSVDTVTITEMEGAPENA